MCMIHVHVFIHNMHVGGFSGVHEGQLAYLARTNMKLFEMLVNTVTKKPHLKIAMAGKFASYEFDDLLDIHRFMKDKDTHLITHPLVKTFLGRPFFVFEEYASKIEDPNMIRKIRVSLAKICRLHVHL